MTVDAVCNLGEQWRRTSGSRQLRAPGAVFRLSPPDAPRGAWRAGRIGHLVLLLGRGADEVPGGVVHPVFPGRARGRGSVAREPALDVRPRLAAPPEAGFFRSPF